jgi:hypothetical protein
MNEGGKAIGCAAGALVHPRCGNRRVNLIFEPPAVTERAPIA